MNGVEMALWLVILFALVYEPVFGYVDYQRFKRRVKVDGGARIDFYAKTIIGLWLPVLFILLLVGFTDVTGRDIGFALPGIRTEPMGSLATWAVLALIFLYALALAVFAVGYRRSAKIRKIVERAKEEQTERPSFSDILPVTTREKKWWTWVSLSAGIAEEMLYRGFLVFAFSYLFPGISVWWVILASSVLFGLAHTYQGFAGVIRTAVVGAFFAMLYIATGSLLLPILLHFLIDLMARIESGGKGAAHG